jgi:hypothetical protein
MANAIQTITKYIPLLDQVYAVASCSAVLDTPNALVRETADAKTVLIAKTSMSGLGNYDRAEGFVAGDLTLTWESHTFTYDRGRTFQIDAMDDMETMGMAFGSLASEFIRVKVTPEIDAIRFAKYATSAGLSAAAELSATTAVPAISAAEVQMEENEIALENCVIFMTPTVYGYVKDDTDHFQRTLVPSENPNRNFGTFDNMPVQKVPQTRFYTAIALNDGKTSGQTAGGYKKAEGAVDVNFMIIDRAAVVQLMKHGKIRVFDPDTNQSADAYKIDYRVYHDAWVLENKVKGIYCHKKNA